MKLIRHLLLILLMSFVCATDAKPATVKVLLVKGASSPLIEVKGRYQVINPYDGALLATGILSKRYPLTVEEYGLKWGEKFPGTYQIRILPGDSQSSILVNGIQYKGCVEIYSSESQIDVINEVDVESYLKSTLTAKFPESMDQEVLNALAIVERTNTYYTIGKKPSPLWHVDAREVGYQGIALTENKLYVDRAIDLTRHAILTFQNIPFAATWTPNSAGRTASFAEVFRKAAATPTGVTTPIAAKDRNAHQWTFSISKQTLAKTSNLRTIASADLYLASSKVYAVKFSDGRDHNEIDFFTLQKVLGADKLRSNDFTVSVKGDNLIFTGYGEGFGVGLCLYSARAMAENGEKAPQILSTFFPNTSLEKIKSLEER